ncbi:MAG: ATP-dependent DNA helicase [Puniceicoccaceae bacterium]
MIGLNDAFIEGSVDKPSAREQVEAIFSREGFLEKNLRLDHRPQQAAMAVQTIGAWERDEALFFEAGTGVGKSLAYLVPGILHAMTEARPLVVSTHTIALQEQIEKKDLPLCRKLFTTDSSLQPFAAFREAVLLGRANYLCGARLAQALKAKTELFPSAEQEELARIADWAKTSENGLLQELDPQPLPEVWDWVQADGHACNPRNCSPKTCFFRKAREAVRQANIIIVNHSLLFSLLAAGHFPGRNVTGILFPEDFMVIDEAHTLPAVATEYFGLKLSALGLRRQLLKLYQPQKKKARGLLARHGNPGLRNQVMELTSGAENFFKAIHEEFLDKGSQMRLQQPGWFDNALDMPLRDLIHGLHKLENRLEEGPGRDELEGVRRSLQGYREGINETIQLSDPESVYWLEAGGRGGDRVHLRSAPLEVSGPLRERLFARNTGLLLTSATLAEGVSMDSFKAKVGGMEAAAHQEASPFDYSIQMEICIHQGAPSPSAEDGRLDIDFLARQIREHALEMEGGTLVLFTSYRDLNAVRQRLEPACRKAGRPLLCQGAGMGRSRLLKEMKETGNAILLGTDSFWTGVDVPGSALSQVIITRLPFENPTHPVAEARAERCRREGQSPFAELTLPAALIKFRQGIGRLIRSHFDEGRLLILDSRILSKPYGRLFLEVLPHDQFRKIS